MFYAEAVRTLAQAELAIETARRAARGEIGRLSIGFLGSATSAFLAELVRKFKATYPGVKLTMEELTPVHQDAAFEKEEIGHSPQNRARHSHRGSCTAIRCWLCCRVHDR